MKHLPTCDEGIGKQLTVPAKQQQIKIHFSNRLSIFDLLFKCNNTINLG